MVYIIREITHGHDPHELGLLNNNELTISGMSLVDL